MNNLVETILRESEKLLKSGNPSKIIDIPFVRNKMALQKEIDSALKQTNISAELSVHVVSCTQIRIGYK